jgi:hypothetical protein
MIEKFNWKCSEDKIPQDRIVNEKVYNEIAKREANARLSKETEPWGRIIYKVFHTNDGLSGLDPDEYDYYILNCLIGEVYNGGLEQYFGNTSGDHYSKLLTVLEKYGYLKCIALLQPVPTCVLIPPWTRLRHGV